MQKTKTERNHSALFFVGFLLDFQKMNAIHLSICRDMALFMQFDGRAARKMTKNASQFQASLL